LKPFWVDLKIYISVKLNLTREAARLEQSQVRIFTAFEQSPPTQLRSPEFVITKNLVNPKLTHNTLINPLACNNARRK